MSTSMPKNRFNKLQKWLMFFLGKNQEKIKTPGLKLPFVVSVYLFLKWDVLNGVIRKNNFEITHVVLGVNFLPYIYY